MQNKKPYYVYDDKSVSYVEEKVNTGSKEKKVFLYMFGGVIVAAGIMVFLYYGFVTEETSQLKNRKNQLDAYMVRAEAENEELRRRVIDLENQDQRLREQILGVKE